MEMKLTVYRQAVKERDGYKNYRGEDARPYTGDNVFFVADGLGGASAIRHTKFVPELFDEEKLPDILFKDVLEDYSDEEFLNYVKNSFFEFFAVKDHYGDNVYNIKKSGYFGSRIATSLLLHELIYNEDFDVKHGGLFKKYDELQSEEDKAEFVKRFGEYIAEFLGEKIRKVASNANLIYEGAYHGLALLATTLCATVYCEGEDCVEAFYLTAGDSRPYLWNAEGLCQVVEDEEGSDGGMTNYIQATEGKTFNINCEYRKFKKPCVLFNTSDGCFDSAAFLSQMAFEKVLLENISASQDMQGAAKGLEEFFVTNGTHDDSSTIALAAFGFETYAELKALADKRLEEMAEKFLTELPEVLETDFASKLETAEVGNADEEKSLKAKLDGEEKVKEFCALRIKEGAYEAYNEKIQVIDDEKEKLEKGVEEAKAQAEKIITENFLFLEKYYAMQCLDEGLYRKAKNAKENYQNTVERYKREITAVKNLIAEVNGKLPEKLGELEGIEPQDFRPFNELELDDLCELGKKTNFLLTLKSGKNDVVKNIAGFRANYYSINERAYNAKKKSEECRKDAEDILKRLVADFGDVETAGALAEQTGIFPCDAEKLEALLAEIFKAKTECERLETVEKQKIFGECVPEYWENEYGDVINELSQRIARGEDSGLSEEVSEALVNYAMMLKRELDELRKKADKQNEIFETYDKTYYKLIRGEN